MITASKLLKSCATPPARRPMASIFWDCSKNLPDEGKPFSAVFSVSDRSSTKAKAHVTATKNRIPCRDRLAWNTYRDTARSAQLTTVAVTMPNIRRPRIFLNRSPLNIRLVPLGRSIIPDPVLSPFPCCPSARTQIELLNDIVQVFEEAEKSTDDAHRTVLT